MKNNNKTVGETKKIVQSFLRYTIYREVALGKAGSKAQFKKNIQAVQKAGMTKTLLNMSQKLIEIECRIDKKENLVKTVII